MLSKIEQTRPHAACRLPAMVYGTTFIHWELDFVEIVIFITDHLCK